MSQDTMVVDLTLTGRNCLLAASDLSATVPKPQLSYPQVSVSRKCLLAASDLSANVRNPQLSKSRNCPVRNSPVRNCPATELTTPF